jgi:hypothetical protein
MTNPLDTPDVIWLIDTGDDVCWHADPNPAGLPEEQAPDPARYVRADVVLEGSAMEALRAAQDTFRRYAEHHRAKGATEKAERNHAMANRMSRAMGDLRRAGGDE